MNYAHLLRRNPEYTKLWFAGVVSYTGDWFNTIVLLGLVNEFSEGSGLAISIFLTLRVLPPLLVAPITGVLLDRFNRKHLLVASNLLRALIVPFFLLAQSPDTLWIIYIVTIAQFILSALFEPGQTAIIPALVLPADIVEGNTLLSITWSVMLALGAIIGGLFAYYFGATAALLADAATFAVAGLLIAWIEYDPEQGRKLAKAIGVDPSQKEDTSFMEGLRYVQHTPQMAATLFVKFGQSFGSMDTLLTVFATQLFVIGARGEISQALLWSALGFGALVGPLLTNLLNNGSVQRMRRLIGVGYVLLLLRWIILGWANSLFFIGIACFIGAMGGSINWTYSNIIIQKTAPDEKLGRMFSIDWIGFNLSMLAGTMIHGSMLDLFGTVHLDWIIHGTLVASVIPVLIWVWMVWKLENLELQTREDAVCVSPVSGN